MPRITVDTSNMRRCEGCNAAPPTPLYRHHKGHDKLIGLYNKKVRRSYYKWLFCCLLCDRCHMWIHYYMDLKVLILQRVTRFNAKRIRKKLIAACDEWLIMSPMERPKPSPAFEQQWRLSHKAWLASQQQSR